MKNPESHIILTGPQQTGKSTMLEILTRCGFDTGFTVEEIENKDHGNPKGGNEFLEFRLWGKNCKENLPYIIKHPRLSSALQDRVERLDWRIDRVFIFIRDVDESVESVHQLDRGAEKKALKRRYYARLGKIIYQCEVNEWRYEIVNSDEVRKDWVAARASLGTFGQQIHMYSFKDAWEETIGRQNKVSS